MAGLAALGVLAGCVSYRSGRRTRLLLALGSPLAILLGLYAIEQLVHPCADAEGDCYEELGYLILATGIFLAIELGTVLGLVAAWLFRGREKAAA